MHLTTYTYTYTHTHTYTHTQAHTHTHTYTQAHTHTQVHTHTHTHIHTYSEAGSVRLVLLVWCCNRPGKLVVWVQMLVPVKSPVVSASVPHLRHQSHTAERE